MRWLTHAELARLYAKALDEQITLSPAPRSTTVVFASSASDERKRYVVSEHGCNCAAGSHDKACKHYALYQVEHFARLVSTYGPPEWITGVRKDDASTSAA